MWLPAHPAGPALIRLWYAAARADDHANLLCHGKDNSGVRKGGGGVVFTLTPTPPLSLRLLFIAGSLPLTPSSRERSRENKHALEGDSYEEQARGSLDPLLHVFEWWSTNTFPNNIHTPSSRMCLITSPLNIGWLLPAAFRASSEPLHLSIT